MTKYNIRTQKSNIRPKLLNFIINLFASTSNKCLVDFYSTIFYQVRTYFIIAFIADTGLLISELSKCKMNDIQYDPITDSWFLIVINNSRIQREVYLFESTLELIKQYRRELGLGFTLPAESDSFPIVHNGKDITSKLGLTHINNLIKNAFLSIHKIITSYIKDQSYGYKIGLILRSDLETLEKASSKWLRYSHAYWFNNLKGTNELLTMRRLGIENIDSSIVGTLIFSDNTNFPIDDVKKVSEIYDCIIKENEAIK